MLSIVFKRNFFYSLLITVILTSSLLLSVLLTSEYIAYAKLNDNLDRAIVDAKMVIRVTNFYDYRNLYEDIKSLPEIRSCKLFISREEGEALISSNWSKLDLSKMDEKVLVIGINFTDWQGNISLIRGKPPSSLKEIAVDEKLAEILNVSLGETLQIKTKYGGLSGNFTVVGVLEATNLLNYTLHNDHLVKNQIPLLTINATKSFIGYIWTTLNSSIELEGLGGVLPGLPTYLIFYNRESFLDPWNPTKIFSAVEMIEEKVINLALEYTSITQIQYFSYVKLVLKDYFEWPTGFRLQLSYMVLSILFTSSLFSFVIGWIFVNQRKREIAILRIRGFSNLQIFKLIIAEYVIISLLGSIVGLALASLIASISPMIFLSYFATKYNPIPIVLTHLPSYLYASLLYGFFFGFICVIPSFYVSTKIDISEGLAEYTVEFEQPKPTPLYLIGIVYGLISFLEVLMDLPLFKYITNVLLVSKSALIQVFGFILFIIDAIVISTGPFVLTYSLSSAVSHYSSRLENLLSKLTSILNKEKINYIAIKHLTRRPVRVARMIFLTAILMGLLMEAGFNTLMTNATLEKNVEIFVGSDYRINVIQAQRVINFTLIKENISDGGSEVIVSGAYEYWGYTRRYNFPYIKVIAIDEAYFEAAFLDNNYFHKIKIAEAKEILFKHKKALLSIASLEKLNMTIDSEISLVVTKAAGFLKKPIRVWVGGYFYYLPGLLDDIYEPQRGDILLMLISVDYVKELAFFPDKILVKALGNIDEEAFLNKISEVLRSNNILAEIYSYKAVRDIALKDSLSSIITTLYKMEFIELLLLTFMGIYVLFYSEYLTRKREFAILESRGIEEGDILKIGYIESILVLMFSTIVALIISLNLSLTLQKMVQVGIFGFIKSPLSLQETSPWTILMLMLTITLAVLFLVRVAVKKATKVELAKELRVMH